MACNDKGTRRKAANVAAKLALRAILLAMAPPRHLSSLLLVVLVAAFAMGCATAAPSLPQARRPTPKTVTRDNPAGDAEAPEDAALTRLLEAPVGKKIDKFRTLLVRLPDASKWRRVRLWGQPTRATFRYGNDHYAIAVLDYRDAEGDDAPTRCLERFVKQGRRKAEAFDIELGAFDRSVGRHWRGVEAVDWKAHEAKRKRRAAQRRKKLAALRKKLAARKRKGGKGRPTFTGLRKPTKVRNKTGARSSQSSVGKRIEELGRKLVRLRAMIRNIRQPAHPRRVNRIKGRIHKSKMRRSMPRLKRLRRKRDKPRHGYADMPTIRASGHFSTLFKRDRYVGALVAYRSWPGTCLVHGFAVRVGTDPKLASKVVERWLRELAPRLRWGLRLRKRPEIKNR